MARQRLAVRVPIRPKPTMSKVLLMRSTGSALSRSLQRPVRTRRSTWAPRFASAIIMNSACSATVGELAVPTTISGMRRRVSTATSTVS